MRHRNLAEVLVSIRRELPGVLLFVAAIWLVYFLQEPLGLLNLALAPRSAHGLTGIVAMPFLHGDLAHLASNSPPLVILLVLLAGSRTRAWQIVTLLTLGSGCALWLLGFATTRYIGASMLVFGLIAFLIVSGLRERRTIPILVAVLVGVLYGWTALMGLVPLSREISELSHLIGLVTGVALALGMTSVKKRRR